MGVKINDIFLNKSGSLNHLISKQTTQPCENIKDLKEL